MHGHDMDPMSPSWIGNVGCELAAWSFWLEHSLMCVCVDDKRCHLLVSLECEMAGMVGVM